MERADDAGEARGVALRAEAVDGEGEICLPSAAGWLAVCEGWCLRAAAPHALGEAFDAVGVMSVGAELVPVDVPVGSMAGAGCLDVGWLLARLPAAGDDERAGDGRALGAVYVAGVAESELAELVAGECSPLAGAVELDESLPGLVDVEDSPRVPFSIRAAPGWWCGSIIAMRSPARRP